MDDLCDMWERPKSWQKECVIQDTGNPLWLHTYVNTHFTTMVKTKSGICSIVWTKQNGSIFNNKSLKQVKAAVSKVWASNVEVQRKTHIAIYN